MKSKNTKLILSVIIIFSIFLIRVLKKDQKNYDEKRKKEKSIKVEDISSENFDVFLGIAAEAINKKCPMTVDKDTRLDNAVALSNNTLQYNYTMVNMDVEDMDVEAVKEKFAPHLLNDVKTNPGLKTFRDKNVTLNYNYSDKNGVFIVRFKITPELYKNNND